MKLSPFVKKLSYPAGLALLALLVFAYIFDAKIDSNGDNCHYYILASSLAAGNGYTDMLGNASALFPPGYPLLMTPLRLFTDSIVAQKVLNLLFLFGAVLLLFRIMVAEGLRPALAFIAGAAVLVTPHLLEFSTMMMSEASCIFFITLALWAFLHLSADGRAGLRSPWLLLFLFATVYTFYIRTQAIAFVAAFVVGLFVLRRWRLGLALSGAFAVGVLPWILRNAFLGLEQSRYLSQVDFSRVWRILNMLLVQVVPESIIPFFRVRYDCAPSPQLYAIALAVLALIVYGLCRLKRLRLPLLLFFAGNLALVSIMDTPSFYRYMIIVLPMLTVGVVTGLWSVCDALSRRVSKHSFSPWFMLLLFLPPLLHYGDGSLHTVWELHRSAVAGYPLNVNAYLAIGEEAASFGRDRIVASRKPELLFVSKGVKGVRYKEGRTNVQIVSDLLAANVDYIILENLGFRYTAEVLYPCLKEHPLFFEPLRYTSAPVNVLFRFHKERARRWLISLEGGE
ncbi:MAG: hypothetical protein IJZ22_00945 [Bacteroidaceae bacterium]|nr:hypothetical protein [Bacteroidaceae bacterium]